MVQRDLAYPIQCVLTGKVRESYASMSPYLCRVYGQIKTAVLRVYELVPKAHMHIFRKLSRADSITSVEFGQGNWCQNKNAKDFDSLHESVLLEE